jgi:hypothetical protein
MIKIEIDLESLFKNELSPTQYIMLYFIAQNNKIKFHELIDVIDEEEVVKRSLYRLYRKNFIEGFVETTLISFDSLVITAEGIDVLNNLNIGEPKNYKGTFDEFITAFFNTFPKKIRQGNLLVRSDINSCSKKMKKFLKEYSEYDYDIILKATTNYVNKCSKDGYRYIKVSHYFIYKDNISTLASECEEIKTSIEEGTFNENINYDDEFGKELI